MPKKNKRKPRKQKAVRVPFGIKQIPDTNINIDQILLERRAIFLFGVVDKDSSQNIIKQLLALDRISHKPIALYIDSPGGTVNAGFAIIDIIKAIKSPVVTLVIGRACSMAGLISVVGAQRLMTQHAIWMAHDMAGGIWGDYTTKVLDRAEHLKECQKTIFTFLREHTKLSEKEMQRAIIGELWLMPKDCVNKGIVDYIIGEAKNEK